MAGVFWLPKTEIRNRDLGNQKSEIRLSKGTWSDVITLQPSSQDHDKKPMLRLTCPQVSSLHTRHKEFVPSVLWRVYYSVGLNVITWALLLHWEWRRKLKIFLTLVASWLRRSAALAGKISANTWDFEEKRSWILSTQRPATVFGQDFEQNGTGKCSKEVHFSSLFLSPYLLVTVFIQISAQPRSAHPKGRKS